MTIKFYIASKFALKEETKKRAEWLESIGWECTARWIDGGEDGLTHSDIAVVDLEDIDKADAIILFTHPRGQVNTNGRMVEFGYAMGKDKALIVIGPEENVFLAHPNVMMFDDWEDFVSWIKLGMNNEDILDRVTS